MADTLVKVEDGIMVITINRPEAKNAMNRAAAEIIADAMERLDNDADIRVAIITGAGGTFCSGMDLKGYLRGELPSVKGKGFAGFVEAPPQKPLIAAVDGYALAGGLETAIACDMIIANKDAKFGIPETKRGLVAAAGGLMRLPRLIPQKIAMELALTGEFIDAQRGYELGLVNQLTDGAALDAAMILARKITANGPLAVRISKSVIAKSGMWDEDIMWDKQIEIIKPIFTSSDAREGAAAFAEKRSPNWTGK
ncbi:enoyl-CoA hydratase [Sphingorhabdus lutea]|uniref:Enoyl-CoA hydratase n=1 Tax=Sphingorhabdus lutea TaxID=1913578 RepID=A0A1L3J9N2_9SPHN|nr:crotonase/enoyl-CoA hydratase family protein [Sphingorhabdus lutea]APG61837.1 enoyl-CoA hydratase [Sphingorhabdus lutea]